MCVLCVPRRCVCSDMTMMIWDVSTGEATERYEHHTEVRVSPRITLSVRLSRISTDFFVNCLFLLVALPFILCLLPCVTATHSARRSLWLALTSICSLRIKWPHAAGTSPYMYGSWERTRPANLHAYLRL